MRYRGAFHNHRRFVQNTPLFSVNEHVNRMNIVEMDANIFLFLPVKTRICYKSTCWHSVFMLQIDKSYSRAIGYSRGLPPLQRGKEAMSGK